MLALCISAKPHRQKIDVEENKVKLKLHKLRAKKYYQLQRESRNSRDVLTVVFDTQQNLPLSKINITETYYSRRLWLYNLGIIIAGRRQPAHRVFFYTWLECDSGKGSNEVCSALRNFLRTLKNRAKKRGYRRLHLYRDGCPAQNKNLSMLMALLTYVNSRDNCFQEVRIMFPVRGHSYSSADTVFGRLEKQFRRRELIKTPNNYYEIMRSYGRLKHLNQDWQVYDYKEWQRIT